ncbi:hypothetical protein T484DRAFT_1787158 [Baffinella frigidus]|nr:hypothetical protein T484DRAFT_1787158 [Cryptophyta sp. CCMP2293]
MTWRGQGGDEWELGPPRQEMLFHEELQEAFLEADHAPSGVLIMCGMYAILYAVWNPYEETNTEFRLLLIIALFVEILWLLGTT